MTFWDWLFGIEPEKPITERTVEEIVAAPRVVAPEPTPEIEVYGVVEAMPRLTRYNNVPGSMSQVIRWVAPVGYVARLYGTSARDDPSNVYLRMYDSTGLEVEDDASIRLTKVGIHGTEDIGSTHYETIKSGLKDLRYRLPGGVQEFTAGEYLVISADSSTQVDASKTIVGINFETTRE